MSEIQTMVKYIAMKYDKGMYYVLSHLNLTLLNGDQHIV